MSGCGQLNDYHDTKGYRALEDYSFLMSVYHKENPQFVREAIESMLHQTQKSEEIFVVCDGPLTPELDAVLEGYRERHPELFTIFRLPNNVGLGQALAEGIRRCRNELVARMDSDDISLPDRMEKELAQFRQNPDLSVVGGQIAEFKGSISNILDYRMVPISDSEIRQMLKKRNPMNHVTTVMKRSDVIACGSYKNVYGFEDYVLWANMLHAGKRFGNIDAVCVYVRVDDDMYKRRSGKNCFRGAVVLEKILKSNCEITHFEYMKNIVVRFIGYRVAPNFVRKILYQTMLREKPTQTQQRN